MPLPFCLSIGALSAVALYTRSHTAAPILLPYRSRIPNPIIPYRSHTAAPISCHTVPIPSPYRSNTAPIPCHTALCIAYGVWQVVWLLQMFFTFFSHQTSYLLWACQSECEVSIFKGHLARMPDQHSRYVARPSNVNYSLVFLNPDSLAFPSALQESNPLCM